MQKLKIHYYVTGFVGNLFFASLQIVCDQSMADGNLIVSQVSVAGCIDFDVTSIHAPESIEIKSLKSCVSAQNRLRCCYTVCP